MQGITGAFGTYFTREMISYGTNIVAGITPGRGGAEVEGVPVYDTIKEAVLNHGAEATVTFVPAPWLKDAVFEAIDNGIRLIACVVEGVPVKDMMIVRKRLAESDTVMLGPNCPGVVSPGKALLGVMPREPYKPGKIGLMTRSGTFSYKVCDSLSKAGIGQSTAVGVGGDPVTGVTFIDILEMFEKDPDTEAMVLVGEIGGTGEENAAEYIKSHIKKPVVAIILGLTAPPGKPMGHAGAIATEGKGSYASKVHALESAGVPVAKTPGEVPLLLSEKLGHRG